MKYYFDPFLQGGRVTVTLVTWASTGKYLQTHLSIQKPPHILTIPKAKLNLAFKMIRTPKIFCKLKHNGPFKNHTMYKPVHRLENKLMHWLSHGAIPY